MTNAVITDEQHVLPDFVLGQPLEPVPIPLGVSPLGEAPAAGAPVAALAICTVLGLVLWYTVGRRPR